MKGLRGWIAWVGLPAVGLVLMLAIAVAGPGGWWELRQREARVEDLQASHGEVQASTDRLTWELAQAEADPVVLERLLAEEHGHVAPGGVLYRFDDADGGSELAPRP